MTIQELSKNAPKIMGTYLLNKPFLVASSFEFQRVIGNIFSQYMYKSKVENNFSKKGLINGANKAITLSAHCIKNQKWDVYSNFAANELIFKLPDEIDKKCDKDKKMLEKLLQTASWEENIRRTIIVSTLFTGDKITKMNENNDVDFHASFVSYIKNPENSKNEYYCNINISRKISPLGKWKITGVNFFDNTFATQSI